MEYYHFKTKLPKSTFEYSSDVIVVLSMIHATTRTKSATKDGTMHLRMAVFPRRTNSSFTLTSYICKTAKRKRMENSKIAHIFR